MSTGKHYFVEQNENGDVAVRAKGSKKAGAILPTQREAIDRANELNPDDRPDVETHPAYIRWRSRQVALRKRLEF